MRKDAGELMEAECKSTEYALLKAAKPSWSITLPEVNAYTLGQLMYFFEMQTAYMGELMNVDAFNQPGVEEGKNAAYALLGRAGYENKAAGAARLPRPGLQVRDVTPWSRLHRFRLGPPAPAPWERRAFFAAALYPLCKFSWERTLFLEIRLPLCRKMVYTEH